MYHSPREGHIFEFSVKESKGSDSRHRSNTGEIIKNTMMYTKYVMYVRIMSYDGMYIDDIDEYGFPK